MSAVRASIDASDGLNFNPLSGSMTSFAWYHTSDRTQSRWLTSARQEECIPIDSATGSSQSQRVLKDNGGH